NIRGTDLGIPLVTGTDLHVFFGDTMGYEGIWKPGEDPDSVARISASAVANDSTTLCRNLDFYSVPGASVAAGIESDFAAAWMTPPDGESLGSYISQSPPGFANIPGTFEVPSGALSHGGAAYIFYAGRVTFAGGAHATQSYLARWDSPGATTGPAYRILHEID